MLWAIVVTPHSYTLRSSSVQASFVHKNNLLVECLVTEEPEQSAVCKTLPIKLSEVV